MVTASNSSMFVKTLGGWVERRAEGHNSYFAEVENKDDIVVIFDASRNMSVRLHSDHMEWSNNKKAWNRLHPGEWK